MLGKKRPIITADAIINTTPKRIKTTSTVPKAKQVPIDELMDRQMTDQHHAFYMTTEALRRRNLATTRHVYDKLVIYAAKLGIQKSIIAAAGQHLKSSATVFRWPRTKGATRAVNNIGVTCDRRILYDLLCGFRGFNDMCATGAKSSTFQEVCHQRQGVPFRFVVDIDAKDLPSMPTSGDVTTTVNAMIDTVRAGLTHSSATLKLDEDDYDLVPKVSTANRMSRDGVTYKMSIHMVFHGVTFVNMKQMAIFAKQVVAPAKIPGFDMAVYKTNQVMRCLYCDKAGDVDSTLVPRKLVDGVWCLGAV